MATTDQRILGDKYRLVRLLDEGGMGAVWLAEHLSLHSPVAVKLLNAAIGDSEEGVQRFLREARAAASLRSPHVVQILDYGVDQGTPYIVMELLDGESLAERLERAGRLSPQETDHVLRHVARAVARAHDASIVHRDLKPANIYIIRNEDEELVKLLDFGIAKAAVDVLGSSIANNTRTGAFLGTPFYVSPEQAEGVKTLDHRTDIWSLGVIAYECLLGKQPFVGETFGSLVLAICSRPMPVPSQQGSVPPGFDGWFACACAREVEQRFQTVREAAAALRQVLVPGAADVAPPTQLSEGVPPGRTADLELSLPPLEAAALGEPPGRAPALLGDTTGVVSSSATTRRRPTPSRARALGAFGLGALVLLLVLLRWSSRQAPAGNEGSSAAVPAQAALLAAPPEPRPQQPLPASVANEPEGPRVSIANGGSSGTVSAPEERSVPVIAPVPSSPAAEGLPLPVTPARATKAPVRATERTRPRGAAPPSKPVQPAAMRPVQPSPPAKPRPSTTEPAVTKPAGKHGVNLGI